MEKSITWLVLCVTVTAFAIFYFKLGDIVNSFRNFSVYYLVLFLAVSLLIVFSYAFKWKIILKTLGFNIPLINLFIYRIAGFAVSYITPIARIGGEPTMANLLKQNYNIEYEDGISSIIISHSIEFFLDGVFTCSCLVVIMAFTAYAFNKNTTIFMALFSLFLIIIVFLFYKFWIRKKNLITSLVMFFRLHKIKYISKYMKSIHSIEESFVFFFSKKKEFKIACLLYLISWILMFVEYKLALLLLGYNASFIAIFIFIVFIRLSFLVPIPASLGVQEILQSIASVSLGLGSGIGFALSLIIRSRDVLLMIIGFSYLTLRHIIKIIKCCL